MSNGDTSYDTSFCYGNQPKDHLPCYGYFRRAFKIDELRFGLESSVRDGDGLAVEVVGGFDGAFDGEFAVERHGRRPDGADGRAVGLCPSSLIDVVHDGQFGAGGTAGAHFRKCLVGIERRLLREVAMDDAEVMFALRGIAFP